MGVVSNAHAGADFEQIALAFFSAQGVALTRNFRVEIGFGAKRYHSFDLGSAKNKLIIECKSHRWTIGNKVPSAKLTVWNEAMLYFHLAPAEFRKILFVLHHRRQGDGESLLAYYKRTYAHLIPVGVEFLEWDETVGNLVDGCFQQPPVLDSRSALVWR